MNCACFNVSIISSLTGKVYREFVRCVSANPNFLAEFSELKEFYRVCENNFELRNKSLAKIGIPQPSSHIAL